EPVPRGGLDHLTRRQPTQQPALKQVLLPADAGGGDHWVTARAPLELQQTLQHVDRRIKRAARRAPLLLAVPATVRHLLAEDPADDAAHVFTEVSANGNSLTVDTRLDLALEVGLLLVFPAAVGAHTRDGASHRVRGGVDTKLAEELECRRRRRPLRE